MATHMDSKGHARGGSKLFEQARIGSMSVKNRIVRSATAMAAASGGQPSEEYVRIYTDLAQGGVGTIISGVMLACRDDARHDRQVYAFDDNHLEGLSRLVQAVRQGDSTCRIVAQLGHSGEDVGPSGIRWSLPWRRAGRELTTTEVDGIVDEFAHAVRRVKLAGFDGAQLHGAHGYLLSSFLSPATNRRSDQYGGSLEKRVQIIRAIVEKASDLVGPGFPILIKVNSDDSVAGGIDQENFPALVDELVAAGIAAIEISSNDPMKRGIKSIEDEAYFFAAAQGLDVSVPVILTGGNRTLDHLEALLQTNEIDFVGLSRPLIREPDLPNRWLRGKGEPRAGCISCNGCFRALLRGQVSHCTQLQRADT